jgi:L-lactate permease
MHLTKHCTRTIFPLRSKIAGERGVIDHVRQIVLNMQCQQRALVELLGWRYVSLYSESG